MNDDRVPQSLLDAFVRGPDGQYRVRRFHPTDLVALVAAVLLPLVLGALVLLGSFVVHALADDDAAPVPPAAVAGEPA